MPKLRTLLALLPSVLLPPALLPPGALLAQGAVTAVPPGREIRDNKLLSPNLTDVWKLDAEQDEVVWCVVESGAFDPVLELFDSDHRLLAENNGSRLCSELSLRLLHKGPIEFHVHGLQGAGGGPYSFWLQRYRTGSLASQGEASHTFGQEQWWHWRIALHAGEVLVPTVQGDGHLTAVFAADRSGLAEWHGGYFARVDGDCTVRVEGPEGHRCQLTTQLARPRDLPGGATEDATPPFGLDIWRMPLVAGTAYAIDLAMPAGRLEYEARERDPGRDPALVWTGANFDKGGRWHPLLYARRDCALEILLRNRGGEPVPYRLVLTAPAAELAPDAASDRRLRLGDGDLYRVPLEVGQLLRLSVASRAFDARFDVWDPDGNVIAQGIDDKGPLDRDAEHTFLVPRTGCYRVLVYTAGGAGSGDYTLRADRVPIPELRLGERLPVQVGRGSAAYAHLELQAGQEVWLSVRSTAFDAGLQVLDPTGNGGFVCEGGGCGGDVLVAYRSSHGGVHTLLVHSRGGAGAGEVRALLADGP